ncbi:MAG TPA: N-acetylmuramoyl-L-alanine amidase [Spirochaetota bacterium]|nr:N-acetylmuramoyl-L-alanine amidase [Spirochaetota bacterium]HOD13675.1 N-acetylmuramoyl-L-alanine amidase [Spirochaetota bacterium]HPG50616.1 N-acetylmuramoyl-L-alanine amidase [Spirochaetota bacterium]HPN12917.1 N-acetylmuramoyl-L-alanine amidase [Spirochaetota bacterium]HQL81698.1 N-acetylmuramoyl-L-alanine amidase [Spirochaetota bacterium]
MKQIALLVMIVLVFTLSGCDKRTGRLRLLLGDDSLNEYVSVEKDSVTMFASPSNRKKGIVECRIYKEEYATFVRMLRVLDDEAIRKAYRAKGAARFDPAFAEKIASMDDGAFRPGRVPGKPLAGLRVAIDPGHSAGSMKEAKREGKYISMVSPEGRKVEFFESSLNLATARALREMLERDGATVMLTREKNSQVYPVPFDRWVRTSFRESVQEKLRDKYITPAAASRLLHRAGDRQRLKFFNSEYEMPYRARLINAFRPHVTVLAHYDASGGDEPFRTKYLRIKEIMAGNGNGEGLLDDVRWVIESIPETKRNFTTVFVPGCFLRGELETLESRIELLRLVLSDDLDESIRYSKFVVDNFSSYLDIQAATDRFPGAYRTGICRRGVYARNFRMTRLVRGPLCLGEPLQQNYMKEALRLSEIGTGKTPDRVLQVARAYYHAIRKYAGNRRTGR